ncbi:hypothetical protein IE81DRAFT_350284 [Ceraceosorus guamensis]|uniref:Uncharacterized protein n=1 Tax=Ceraceosorus guamensis TaxID=1522189 RepID=A0A316VP18_9BASI|nr:hypothetical protein IE81DRAFT_350284 [Ceraceosorus guamensis]PWN39317.1 hypothetical protein IE81DRAFT_350284 [Ceraceosorus guamensis]
MAVRWEFKSDVLVKTSKKGPEKYVTQCDHNVEIQQVIALLQLHMDDFCARPAFKFKSKSRVHTRPIEFQNLMQALNDPSNLYNIPTKVNGGKGQLIGGNVLDAASFTREIRLGIATYIEKGSGDIPKVTKEIFDARSGYNDIDIDIGNHNLDQYHIYVRDVDWHHDHHASPYPDSCSLSTPKKKLKVRGFKLSDSSAWKRLLGSFVDRRAIESGKTQHSTAVVDPVSDGDEACEEELSSSLGGAVTISSSTSSKLHSPSPTATASHAPLLSSSHAPITTTRPLKSSPLPTASQHTPTISSKLPSFLPTSKSAHASGGLPVMSAFSHAPSPSAVATRSVLNPLASKSAPPIPKATKTSSPFGFGRGGLGFGRGGKGGKAGKRI